METGIKLEQMKALYFRKERLEKRLRELEGRISGLRDSFLPLVRDGEGKYSEELAWELIDRLMEAYCTCLSFGEDGLGGDGEGRTLEQEEEELYRSFLYCAIRYAECPPRWDSDCCELPVVRGTYGDILWFARNLAPTDESALLFCETYRPWEMEGFFACMDELYHKISADSVVRSADDADYLLMQETYRQEILRLEREGASLEADQQELREMMGDDEWQEMLRQTFEDPALEEGVRETAEENIRQQQRQESWLTDFKEQDTFCQRYLLFRKAYFRSPFRWRFARDIERMLDIALLQEGASYYLNNDFFFYVLAVLDKTEGLLNRLLTDRR